MYLLLGFTIRQENRYGKGKNIPGMFIQDISSINLTRCHFKLTEKYKVGIQWYVDFQISNDPIVEIDEGPVYDPIVKAKLNTYAPSSPSYMPDEQMYVTNQLLF